MVEREKTLKFLNVLSCFNAIFPENIIEFTIYLTMWASRVKVAYRFFPSAFSTLLNEVRIFKDEVTLLLVLIFFVLMLNFKQIYLHFTGNCII